MTITLLIKADGPYGPLLLLPLAPRPSLYRLDALMRHPPVPQPPAAQPVPVPPALSLALRAAVPHPAAPAARVRLERQLAGPLQVGAGGVEAPQPLTPAAAR